MNPSKIAFLIAVPFGMLIGTLVAFNTPTEMVDTAMPILPRFVDERGGVVCYLAYKTLSCLPMADTNYDID